MHVLREEWLLYMNVQMFGWRVCMQSCTYTHGLYLQNKIVINIVVCMKCIHIELLLSQNIKMEVYS